jgi:hypothetical protein
MNKKNFSQTGRISVYLRVICIFPPTLFTLVEVQVPSIVLKYVRDRPTKTRFKMATEQYTSPKTTYIFVLWLHQLAWSLALYERKDSCFCSRAYCGWSRHFVIRGQAKKTSRFASMYRVLKSQTHWRSLCISLWSTQSLPAKASKLPRIKVLRLWNSPR